MTRKNWLSLLFVLLLIGASLYLNRDWFATDTIHIIHRSRPMSRNFFRKKKNLPIPDDSLTDPIFFGFNKTLRLTSLQVFPVSDIQTNKYPHPIWHLVSDSNSIPVRSITYGMNIKGMRPAVKGATPDPLLPGVNYRLAVAAGSQKAEHDFIPTPRTP
jgi:hypothetical protein